MAVFSAQLETQNSDPDYKPVPRAFYLFALGLSLCTLLSLWLVVPGVIVRMNLPKNSNFLECAGVLLILAGAVTVFTICCVYRAIHDQAAQTVSASAQDPPPSTLAAGVFSSLSSLLLILQTFFSSPLPEPRSSILVHLYWTFCIGAFGLGAIIAASTLPLCNVLVVKAQALPSAWSLLSRASYLGNRALRTAYFGGACSGAAFLGIVLYYARKAILLHRSRDFMAAYRSLDLTNGVSPLVPVTLIVIALAALAFVQLRRMAYYDDRCPEVPDLGENASPSLKTSEIKDLIRTWKFRVWNVFLLILFAAALFLAFIGPAQTLEPNALERFLVLGAVLLGCFILLIWLRLLLVWFSFSEFLQQIERHPIRQVFSLLPRGFIWSPVWQGGGKKRVHVAVVRSLECMQALVHHKETPEYMKLEILPHLDGTSSGSLAWNTRELLDAAASQKRFSGPKYRQIEQALLSVTRETVTYLNTTTWKRGGYELKTELATKEETKEALHLSKSEFMRGEPATICSELVAFRFLAFINFVLWHIDNLVTYVSVGFLLLVIALNSYSFRSKTIIDWTMAVLFLVLTAGIVCVFAQADRDAILSRITGTEEGKLDRHFFTHLISYGGVPALVLLATHFPTIGRFFFSWVKPALEAIH